MQIGNAPVFLAVNALLTVKFGATYFGELEAEKILRISIKKKYM